MLLLSVLDEHCDQKFILIKKNDESFLNSRFVTAMEPYSSYELNGFGQVYTCESTFHALEIIKTIFPFHGISREEIFPPQLDFTSIYQVCISKQLFYVFSK